MEIITSLENKKIKLFSSLKLKKNRDKYGLFIVQEIHLIKEAIAAGVLDTLILRQSVNNCFPMDGLVVSDEVMKKLSDNTSLNDYIAVCKIKPIEIKNYNHLIVLENVQDPGNVGTIIRTAYSFGYDGVMLSQGCADIYNAKTIQSSQGALFHLPIHYDSIENILKLLKDNKVTVYGTELKSSHYLKDTDIADQYALVMGNEGQGLTKETLEKCDQRIKIEMDRFESLNVAIATGIAAYYFKYCK